LLVRLVAVLDSVDVVEIVHRVLGAARGPVEVVGNCADVGLRVIEGPDEVWLGIVVLSRVRPATPGRDYRGSQMRHRSARENLLDLLGCCV
jgi:hypothetical protein